MSRAKVGIVLRQEFARSFVDSGILCDLTSHLNSLVPHGCDIVVLPTSPETQVPNCLNRINTLESWPQSGVSVAALEHEIISWQNSKENPAISFRLRNMLYPRLSQHIRKNIGNFQFHTSNLPGVSAEKGSTPSVKDKFPQLSLGALWQRRSLLIKACVSIFKWGARNFLRLPLMFLASRQPHYSILRLVMERYLTRKSLTLSSRLAELNLDLLLIPSGGLDPLVGQLIRAAKSASISTMLLADNWDQMGSKAVFPQKPDFLCVIGEQSKIHATKVLGFCESDTFVIGCSTYAHYSDDKISSIKLGTSSANKILFIGSSLYSDEIGSLLKIQQALEESKESFGDLEIFFRPHPLRQAVQGLISPDFRLVKLDPHFEKLRSANVVESRGIGTSFALETYLELFRQAKFVVMVPTSMLLEASLLGKKIILLGHSEGSNPTSPEQLLKNFLHLHGVDQLPNVTVCKDLDDIGRLMRDQLHNLDNEESLSKSLPLSHFIETPAAEYTSRLARAIHSALVSTPTGISGTPSGRD